MGLGVDGDGVIVRNFARTYCFDRSKVRRFVDGSVFGGAGERWWALNVVLRDGRAVIAKGTAAPRASKTVAAIRQAAERYQYPAELTGTVGSREPLPPPRV